MAKKPQSEHSDNLRAAAARIVESGVLGSGQVLSKLFEYLVERAIGGDVPKEFDIAVDVFGKDATHRDGGDAQIRVWIYRLRSRLERYYAGPGRNDAFQIAIPKGTYKIDLSDAAEVHDAVPRRAAHTTAVALVGAVVAAALAVLATTVILGRFPPSDAYLVADPVWSGVAESDLPILIVLGDHFFFGDPDSHVRVRDIYINSKADLHRSAEFRSNPSLVFDTLSYLPKSAAFALPEILSRVNAMNRNYALKLASELTPEDIRVADIVFIGFIRAMSVLREYYFKHSGFRSQSPYLELVQASTRDSFTRTGPLPQENTDYGLFARLEGPTGNQILLFSGIGDPGVLATARVLNSADGVRELERFIASSSLDSSENWEVLLEVDGHSRTDLDYRMIGLWSIDRRATHHDAQRHRQASR